MLKICIFILLGFSCNILFAQERPDAGSIQKQIEDQRNKSPLPSKEETKKIKLTSIY
jgi:hypothetical protein